METADVLTVDIQDGIATLWLDQQGESQNIVSPAVVAVLADAFNRLEADPSVRAIVLISRKDNFIAGADIKAFAIDTPGQFRPIQEAGHEALRRLETSQKPSVAAIHGACLGLGTELALACHARIASDHPTTRLALPEVRLGLLPGGGGTQRLPRRVGIQAALDLMLTGRNVYAHQARTMGLVDDVVDSYKLHHAARVMARRLAEGKKPKRNFSFRRWLLEGNPLGRALVFRIARRRALGESRGNYPAVPAILACVETGYRQGIVAGYRRELELFEPLLLSSESQAMRALFFAMSDAKKTPFAVPPRAVQTLAVVGAGFMGAGIAEVSLLQGIEVIIKDIRADALAHVRRDIWKELEKKVRYRTMTRIEAEALLGRLVDRLEFERLERVDMAIEAVVERIDVKQIVIADIFARTGPDTIVATNTSALSVTEMAEASGRPQQVVGMHYFSPVPKMPLVEIVRTPHTSESVLATCHALGVRQGKTCIVVRDSPGFYVNRILAPYMNEALLLVGEGAGIEDVDRALQQAGFRVGPLRLFDEVGLDIAAHVAQSTAPLFAGREGVVISPAVTRMYEAGRLGKKNRQGFYRYRARDGKRQGEDPVAYAFFDGRPTVSHAQNLHERPMLLLLNEAVRCLEEGVIASATDGDLGAVLGIGFPPFTGGPFRYMDQRGIAAVVDRMEALAERLGQRFLPIPRLREMAQGGARFYAG